MPAMGRRCAVLLIGLAGCAEKPEPAREAAGAPPAQGPVKILHFYAGSGLVARGEPVTVCYGVENARAVRIEPPVRQLTPLLNRCFQVSPERTTTYKLLAEGHDGVTVSESFTIRVSAARPATPPEQRQMIRLFVASAEQISRGQTVTLCYGVQNAASVRIRPPVQSLEPADKFCIFVRPPQTATYVLIATGPDGQQESAEVTVTVR